MGQPLVLEGTIFGLFLNPSSGLAICKIKLVLFVHVLKDVSGQLHVPAGLS